jgi:hypothetical protein
MAIVEQSRFKVYELNEYEIASGAKLSELQRQVIQNNIAGYAHDIINVQWEPEVPQKAEYLRNYYRGCIEALEHLLHTDEALRYDEETAAKNDRFQE